MGKGAYLFQFHYIYLSENVIIIFAVEDSLEKKNSKIRISNDAISH